MKTFGQILATTAAMTIATADTTDAARAVNQFGIDLHQRPHQGPDRRGHDR